MYNSKITPNNTSINYFSHFCRHQNLKVLYLKHKQLSNHLILQKGDFYG